MSGGLASPVACWVTLEPTRKANELLDVVPPNELENKSSKRQNAASNCTHDTIEFLSPSALPTLVSPSLTTPVYYPLVSLVSLVSRLSTHHACHLDLSRLAVRRFAQREIARIAKQSEAGDPD